MRCPVCETENRDDDTACATCGKALLVEADLVADVAPLEGLEETIRDPLESAIGPVQVLPEVEFTPVARKDLAVAVEIMKDVERTPIEADPDAVSHWSTAGVDLDLGRAPDDGVRTPAPQDAKLCPWCGVASDGAVCDSCGRRKIRYLQAVAAGPEAAADPNAEKVHCPACLSRVMPGPRCSECGLPFPIAEIL
jgi:hypothetical protein